MEYITPFLDGARDYSISRKCHSASWQEVEVEWVVLFHRKFLQQEDSPQISEEEINSCTTHSKNTRLTIVVPGNSLLEAAHKSQGV